jgi:hypothetical protein
MRYSLILILFFIFLETKAQNNKGNFELEIVNSTIGLYVTSYSTRSEGIQKMGEEFGFFGQVYFPFQWSVDYDANFNDSLNYKGVYNKRIFLIRPQALFSVTQQGNVTGGIALQLSWLLFKAFYLDYGTGIIWVEAGKLATDGLVSGLNLNQTISISKPLNNHLTLSLGFNHLSSAHIFDSKANQDAIFLGMKCIF